MEAFLNRPGFLGTYGTIGADLSFLLAVGFTVLFIMGWQKARKAKGRHHHTITLWAMIAMLGYFVFYYLSRGLGALAAEGKEGFGGSKFLYDWIFSPLLTLHVAVVSVGIIMAVYMIILGYRVAQRKGQEMVLKAGELKVHQKTLIKISIWAFGVFILVFVSRSLSTETGFTAGKFWVYFSGFLLVALVLGLERFIERALPDGERRHRLLGTFTMVLYVVALFTTAITNFLLYVAYPPIHS
jgi:uncharacterized membrane protein YozB (DUF420 family)